jgi:hypothetical protein
VLCSLSIAFHLVCGAVPILCSVERIAPGIVSGHCAVFGSVSIVVPLVVSAARFCVVSV